MTKAELTKQRDTLRGTLGALREGYDALVIELEEERAKGAAFREKIGVVFAKYERLDAANTL